MTHDELIEGAEPGQAAPEVVFCRAGQTLQERHSTEGVVGADPGEHIAVVDPLRLQAKGAYLGVVQASGFGQGADRNKFERAGPVGHALTRPSRDGGHPVGRMHALIQPPQPVFGRDHAGRGEGADVVRRANVIDEGSTDDE